MKVPLIWLQDYVDIKGRTPLEIARAFTQLGLMLDKPPGDSGVLDLEHRMDRADWLSILGCARDLAAYYEIKLNVPRVKLGRLKSQVIVPITVSSPHVRRFKTRVIQGVRVQPSPEWLKSRLSAYGIDPINNIVDITNFCLVELGQPMHAQDLSKLDKREVTIRPAKKGESITTLLGTRVPLTPEIFVLSSGGSPTVIGGIVGGQVTGVTHGTTDIFLDAGNYNQNIIRKNSRSLKILNESVSRYDKFLDPRAIDLALDRATALILELAGGTAYENDDYYPVVTEPSIKRLRYSRLELLSGMQIPQEAVKKILKNLGYIITEESKLELTVEVPYFRTDVEVEDDLVADILRIGDYNNLPSLSLTTPAPADMTKPLTRFEDKLRETMTALGAHEHITSSLVKSSNDNTQISLENALSTDQNALRVSLVPGLRRVLNNYAKHGVMNCTLYEIGKVFKLPSSEQRHLSAVANNDIRACLASLLHSLGISSYQINNNLQIVIAEQVIGTLHNEHAFTVLIDMLLPHTRPYTGVTSEFNHATTLDLSLRLPKGVLYTDVETFLKTTEPQIQQIEVPEEYQDSLLLRLTFKSQLKDVDGMRTRLIKSLKAKGVVSRSG